LEEKKTPCASEISVNGSSKHNTGSIKSKQKHRDERSKAVGIGRRQRTGHYG
jgi:hypothetical protein